MTNVPDILVRNIEEAIADRIKAIAREKQIKNWKRQWKVALVEGMNPYWRDLYGDILGE